MNGIESESKSLTCFTELFLNYMVKYKIYIYCVLLLELERLILF